ncbi:YeeE/YedE family protein [Roseibium sp. CAU 1637]|uniref:YeeE/YedE family protein n=1 Tax=Roseibium limicola TaxID=2816037 RepID=A0A939ERH9_9HYPH|nr:YeeE/YedE thiosulfate transporter family protein [Roseibium limicola]MBO0346218.1 YeeE/YedE family protein [Roseibium limicola]
MTEFTPLWSFAGGALIGLAAVLLMAVHGRIAGMTGILTGVLPPVNADWPWRAAFLVGAILAPALIIATSGEQAIGFDSTVPPLWLVIGGLLVGVGVYLGSGCTSGHGVCGMSRLSLRSFAATGTFMLTTAITVFVVRHIFGGF